LAIDSLEFFHQGIFDAVITQVAVQLRDHSMSSGIELVGIDALFPVIPRVYRFAAS
jgi:hypothetical protein